MNFLSCRMCNLYHVSPKGDLTTYFRSMPPDGLVEAPIGPFGQGTFVRRVAGERVATVGQWGLIRPGQPERIDYLAPKAGPAGKARKPRPRSTNNARVEGIEAKPTFKAAWKAGQRCLVPAQWYQEPNWETGRNVWWQLRRADGLPWALAGLWSEWIDPQTGEVVPNFTLITCNCDAHPLLARLHKPDTTLPADGQDKRSLVHIEPEHWAQWLEGSEDEARALIQPPPLAMFDLADARRTDQLLAAQRAASA
ncbi:SOS response-associated peptidase family protein [Pelomonas sp. APW6]|uniref:Abasic site processing protein n=1 Tax=Roseateles subflavus TaxID=3053353 RepID=A0ABT7LCP1_9BURK|nr:SOS response-associated peptidase family protein [Pelomonas sp. APW6]MDL5030633.1 SOS response-associated peptidase family protein [Pelomonas sp. APW6]